MKEEQFRLVNAHEPSLAERTAEQIARLIVERQLTSEDKLPSEFELAEMLNVGRGTVREGVKLLVARHVLEIRRGKGTYLAPNPGEVPDPLGFAYYPDQYQLALDLAEIRGNMEPWVARMAAERARPGDLEELRAACSRVEEDILAQREHAQNDIRFHVAVAECTHNLVVPKLIPIITYAVSLFVSLTEGRLRMETLVGHREIMEAVCSRNAGRAEEAMAQHIEYNRKLLVEMRGQLKESFTFGPNCGIMATEPIRRSNNGSGTNEA